MPARANPEFSASVSKECTLGALVSLLLRLLVFGMLVASTTLPAHGEKTDRERERAEAGMEWTSLAKGRTEFEVSDPALVPSRLTSAARLAGCKIEDGIASSSVRFAKLESHRLAIVFCSSIVGSHMVFDLSTLERPRLIRLPIIKMPEGFGTTDRPGWLTREKETSIFEAETTSDMKPSWDLRHTYQFNGSWDFVVIRVEVKGMHGHDKWTTIWEAPGWTFPEVKQ
jgi:hypothetical protein